MKHCEISIVIPVLNEEETLRELYKRLISILEKEMKISYEIIFIDDGGHDTSWNIIESLHTENSRVKGIQFSRRFGHQYALKAGLDYAKGKVLVSMDADLQHPPEVIHDLYKKWKEGYQIVQALRKDTKGESKLKKMTSTCFYHLLNFLSDIQIEPGSSDFRLLDRQVVDELKRLNERQLFYRGLIQWVGFKHYSLLYIADKRFSGSTKYSFSKMMSFALDGIMSFSTKPLRIAIVLGCIVSLFAFFNIIYALFAHFVYQRTVPGWTSILISVLLLGGIQLITIGIIGEYVGKLYIENKKRQNYIIQETIE
ncbi:glycosyltransferase family 2 protein [bacterium]|nr:glycosyltransferase family 2 protein [bacterium]RQV93784.1 MAG: glycosyltransferase [bacterium]